MLTTRTSQFVAAALSILLIPFFAMLFSVEGWDWHAADYLIVGVLLVGLGVALAAVTNKAFPLKRRLIAVACAVIIVAVYVHLAVGIVDSWPLAGS